MWGNVLTPTESEWASVWCRNKVRCKRHSPRYNRIGIHSAAAHLASVCRVFANRRHTTYDNYDVRMYWRHVPFIVCARTFSSNFIENKWKLPESTFFPFLIFVVVFPHFLFLFIYLSVLFSLFSASLSPAQCLSAPTKFAQYLPRSIEL